MYAQGRDWLVVARVYSRHRSEGHRSSRHLLHLPSRLAAAEFGSHLAAEEVEQVTDDIDSSGAEAEHDIEVFANMNSVISLADSMVAEDQVGEACRMRNTLDTMYPDAVALAS